MKTKRKAKHPSKMTSDELIEHIFHPKIVKHVRGIIEEHNAPKVKKTKATTKR